MLLFQNRPQSQTKIIILSILVIFLSISTVSSLTSRSIPVSSPNPTPSTSQPTLVPISQPVGQQLPLLAFVRDQNVFVSDPNTGQVKQITQNGDIKHIKWSKDGQWLYWYASYGTDTDPKITFARAKTPDFKLDIFLDLDSSILKDSDYISFYPLAKTNKLALTSRTGVYLFSDFSQRQAKKNTKLLTLEPLEGFVDSEYQITDGYSITDLDPQERYLLLNHWGWERQIDLGFIDLAGLPQNYTVIKDPLVEHLSGSATFSPSGKYILISGSDNEMTGEDTQEVIFNFPRLTVYRRLKDIIPDDLSKGLFITDQEIIFPVSYGYLYMSDQLPDRFGISFIDLATNQEINFIPGPHSVTSDNLSIGYYLTDYSTGLVSFGEGGVYSQNGYFVLNDQRQIISTQYTDQAVLPQPL